MGFNPFQFFMKKKPTMLFGKRLYLRKDTGMPDNQIIVLVNPSCFDDIKNRLEHTFAQLNAYDRPGGTE